MGLRTNVWRSVARAVWLGAVWFVTAGSPALAQFETAQISGVIRDATGGVIPGATITATNDNTGGATIQVTDDSGFYLFPNLQPGVYEVTAELQGFKKAVKSSLQLDAAAKITSDFTLETGELTEEVTVTAEAAPLQTDTAVRKTVEARDVQQLMLSGRNPVGLALLKPGVVGGTFNSFGFDNLGNGGYSMSGSRPDENLVTVDGAIALRTRSTGAILGVMNVDALQEVQVLSANYMPEFGRASGGQIRMVTKSGGRDLTGSVYWYKRDELLDANSWSRNRSDEPGVSDGPAPFDYDQYGFTVGGPVTIPGLFNDSRDKLFFFWAEEWVDFFRVDTSFQTVPTERMRQGDFGELLDPNNPFFDGSREIIDPRTGQPFPGNVIPSNRLSPVGMAMLNAYPVPNGQFPDGDNVVLQSPNPRDQRKDNIRVDYQLNGSNRISGRWSHYEWTAIDSYRGGFTFAH
ncbi:MAG: hypothetical protein GEU99_11100 [Luteitalea sp.]|nr:hypothetical protein [Luteitalea sp.]